MRYVISKSQVAVDQLDWAIRLFLDSKAFVPAITLAGAAEEVLGKSVDESAFETVRKRLSIQYAISETIVGQKHLNLMKNLLKHWGDKSDPTELEVDLEAEATNYILRGCINLIAYDKTLPSEGPRFLQWICKKHDLSDFPSIFSLASASQAP